MVVTEKSARGGKTSKTGPKYRKASGKMTAKWKTASADLQNMAVVLLETAASGVVSLEDDSVEETLQFIKHSFKKRLKVLKVPDKKCIPEKEMKTLKNALQAESDRLENLEVNLTEALELEERKVEDLEEKVERLRSTGFTNEDNLNNEIHPILLRFRRT